MKIDHYNGQWLRILLGTALAFFSAACGDNGAGDLDFGLVNGHEKYFSASSVDLGALSDGTLTKELTISSTGTWSISADETWIEVSGSGEIGDNIPVSVTVAPHEGTKSRSAVITAVSEGFEPLLIQMIQLGADVDLKVNGSSTLDLHVDSRGALLTPSEVTIVSNAAWTAELADAADASWVTLNTQAGDIGTTVFDVAFDVNDDMAPREASIVIQVESVQVAVIDIVQEGAEAELSVNGAANMTITVDPDGTLVDPVSIVVASNAAWTSALADAADNWVDLSRVNGESGETDIAELLSFRPNDGESERDAIINMLVADKVIATIEVVQESANLVVEDGTSPETAFLIADADELLALVAEVNGGDDKAGVYYRISRNITLVQEWTPMGSAATPFKGELDGNSKVISGLHITETSAAGNHVGFIGYMSGGSIRNLTVQGDIRYEGSTAIPFIGGMIGQINDAVTIGGELVSDISITVRSELGSGNDFCIGGLFGAVKSTDDSATILFEENTVLQYGKNLDAVIDVEARAKLRVGGVIGLYDVNYLGGTNQITMINNAKNISSRANLVKTTWGIAGTGSVVGGVVGYVMSAASTPTNTALILNTGDRCAVISSNIHSVDVSSPASAVECASAGIYGKNDGPAIYNTSAPEGSKVLIGGISVPLTTTIRASITAEEGCDANHQWSCVSAAMYMARGMGVWPNNIQPTGGQQFDNIIIEYPDGYTGEKYNNGNKK